MQHARILSFLDSIQATSGIKDGTSTASHSAQSPDYYIIKIQKNCYSGYIYIKSNLNRRLQTPFIYVTNLQ